LVTFGLVKIHQLIADEGNTHERSQKGIDTLCHLDSILTLLLAVEEVVIVLHKDLPLG
jgi:hypothetical protein